MSAIKPTIKTNKTPEISAKLTSVVSNVMVSVNSSITSVSVKKYIYNFEEVAPV